MIQLYCMLCREPLYVVTGRQKLPLQRFHRQCAEARSAFYQREYMREYMHEYKRRDRQVSS